MQWGYGDEHDGSTSDGTALDGPKSVHSHGILVAVTMYTMFQRLGDPTILGVPNAGRRDMNQKWLCGPRVAKVATSPLPLASEMDSDSEMVWAKSSRGTRGLGHTFGYKLYFT